MLADGHFTDRVADADDVVTLGKVHRIFAGGLLHRYLFHPDAYHAVDFELATCLLYTSPSPRDTR